MAWKTVETRTLGKNTLRIAEKDGELVGVVISDKGVSTPIPGATPEEIFERLEIESGKQAGRYVGFEGARKRFLDLFPEGFHGSRYKEYERDYKLEAKELLDSICPLEAVKSQEIDCEAIIRVYQKTNLLSQYELMRIAEVLKSAAGSRFIHGAAKFASGDFQSGLREIEAASLKAEAAKWTVATYLPYLWMPNDHMFLKPLATQEFAERVGHPFQYKYSPDLNKTVYEQLLDLAQTTKKNIEGLNPRDYIDIQSFIWIVGRYDENDEAELKTLDG